MKDLHSGGGYPFSLDYLNKLNHYLFCDLYSDCDLRFRILSDDEINYLNELLDALKLKCYNKDNLENLLEIFEKLWEMQPFYTGNTRTLIAYFKIICLAYNLPYEINTDGDIRSSFNAIRKLVTPKK